MRKNKISSQLEDILLKMNYDSRYTLTENKKILEQSQGLGYSYNREDGNSPATDPKSKYLQTREIPQQEGYPEMVAYQTIQGTLWFEKNKLGKIVLANEETVKPFIEDGFESKEVIPDCESAPKDKAGGQELMRKYWQQFNGAVLGFVYDGVYYEAFPGFACSDGSWAWGGYRDNDGNVYKEPELPPAISAEIQKTVNGLVNLSKLNPTTNDEIADFLYKLREIVSSVAFQIFAAALSIAIASIAGPWALFFSKLLDWGIDVIVLLADLIAAMRYPDNETHWTHVGEDVLNIGFSFGIMAVFKQGPKTLRAAIEQLGPADRAAIDQVKEWINGTLDTIIGLLSGTSVAASLTTFKKWLSNLFENSFGKIVSTFVTVGLPIATMMYLGVLLADPVIKSFSEEISYVVNIPLNWLRNWKIGDPIPEEYAKRLEKVDPKFNEKIKEKLSNAEKEVISQNKEEFENKTSDYMIENGRKIAEDWETLVKTDNPAACREVVNMFNGPCKEFLRNQLSVMKYLCEGEKGIVLINNKTAYIIDLDSDPNKLFLNKKEVDCNIPTFEPEVK